MPGQALPNHPLIRSHLRAHERRWSDANRANALSILNRWQVWLAGRDVALVDASRDDCQEYLNWRCGQVSTSTAHKDFQHLRWFYRFLVTEEEIDTRRAHGPMETVKAPKMSEPDPDRIDHVTEDDYARLMSSFSRRSLNDCRDAAICSLMYWTGLRRSEVVRLDRARIDFTTETGQVLGKNGKWRTFPLMWETVDWLERYLRRRDAANIDIGRPDAIALFASISGQGAEHYTTGRLRADAISSMLDRRCAKAGITVTAHQFRRSMAINGKRRGVSDSATMAAAGWSDARMLNRYIREEREQLAVAEFRASDPTRVGRGGRRRRHLRSA